MSTTVVNQYDKATGKLVATHDDCNVPGFDESHIAKCTRGERQSHKGFVWKRESRVQTFLNKQGDE